MKGISLYKNCKRNKYEAIRNYIQKRNLTQNNLKKFLTQSKRKLYNLYFLYKNIVYKYCLMAEENLR